MFRPCVSDARRHDGQSAWPWALAVLLTMSLNLTQATRANAPPEALPDGIEVQSLSVWPEKIEMTRPWDAAQVLITGHLEGGEQVDLTRLSECVNSDATEIVRISPSGQIEPLVDGHDTLVFRWGDQEVSLPVSVDGMAAAEAVSYVQDVSPSLSKMGCNAGTCHGSKDGRNGFKLSLRGYDFLYDHRALTDDIAARRFNRANPEQSLMLLKASGSIPHVGGSLTRPGERRYEILRRWIAAGARLDLDAPRVSHIQVLPEGPILPRANLSQQMVVVAHYTDGTVRDVTAEAFIESGNIEVLSADQTGKVTTLRRGEAPVLARFEGAYAATTVTIMGDRNGFAWNDPPTHGYIDEWVYAKLRRVKVEPSGLCSDAEFVRRVHLDLTGLPPTSEQVRQFLNSDRPSRQKREELIDALVGSADFVEHWTNKWADLLQVNRKFLGDEGATLLRDWIQNAVASNMPYDQFARAILTAKGSTRENPAAAYWKILREPADAMENTTHLFLGVRFNCNKCHDHPFERWTQDQYYTLTAYFAQVGRKEDPDYAGQRIGGSAVDRPKPLVEVIYDATQGDVTHDRTGEIAPPAFPYRDGEQQSDSGSRRDQLAEWITDADNRYFASSYVNRLWGYLTGVGLIEPIDDIRAGNPPTNPELLEALKRDFVESGFDVQHMIKVICRSRVYQHSVATNRWNEDDTINYSHAIPRRLPAEVLYDAIHRASGAAARIPGIPAGFRAAQMPFAGISLPFLDDFGRPARESACECERTSGIVLGPIMKLINGPTVNGALADASNELSALVAREDDDRKVVEEIFLRFLARHPNATELQLGIESLAASREDGQIAQQNLDEFRAARLAKMASWESQLSRPAEWHAVQVAAAESTAGADLEVRSDGTIWATGQLAKDRYALKLTTTLGRITALRLSALADASLPQGGPGRADNGNFVVNEIEASVIRGEQESSPIKLSQARADFSQSGWDVAGAIDNNPSSGWAVSPKFNQDHRATFRLEQPVDFDASQVLQIVVVQDFQDGKHNLGKFRIEVTDGETPFAEDELPDELSKIAKLPPSDRTADQQSKLEEYFLNLDPEYTRLSKVLATARTQAEQHRLTGAQDLAWALINTPSFLFNR